MGTDIAMGVEVHPGACSLWIALSPSATSFARSVLPIVRVGRGACAGDYGQKSMSKRGAS